MAMLTPEEKKRIAEWMWGNCTTFTFNNFDLNDAALVVDELMKRNCIGYFQLRMNDLFSDGLTGEEFMKTQYENTYDAKFLAWLMQSGEATNFFRAFAKWIEEGKDD